MAIYCGPAVWPLLAAYAVTDTWRWALWEVILMSIPVMILLPLLPETSSTKILFDRAQRLRKLSGTSAYLAPSELKPLNFGTTVVQALIKPIEISIKDPAILFTVIYCAIVYGTYYSFFEVLPLTYLGIYHLSLGGIGLNFLSLVISYLIGLVGYVLYLRSIFVPRARHYHKQHNHPVPQEE
jgi:MFS transporter, DHA1 family, multidrug resistance protein